MVGNQASFGTLTADKRTRTSTEAVGCGLDFIEGRGNVGKYRISGRSVEIVIRYSASGMRHFNFSLRGLVREVSSTAACFHLDEGRSVVVRGRDFPSDCSGLSHTFLY